MASRPTASSVYSTTTWKTPGSRVATERLKATGQPAWACRPRAASSSAETIPAIGREGSDLRKAFAQPGLEAGQLVQAEFLRRCS